MSDPNQPVQAPDPRALPEQPGAIAARLSADEVAALAALLGLRPPASVAGAALADATEAALLADDAIAIAVRRDLFARRVLAIDADDHLNMDDDVLAILTAVCSPALTVTVTTDRGAGGRRRTIYAVPGGAIVETPRAVSGQEVMDYMSLPIESIVPSVVQWTSLDSRPAPAARPFTVAAADVTRASEAIAAGDVDGAAAIFQSAADGIEAVAVYARSLSGFAGSNSVEIVHRLHDGPVASLVAWNDCGPAGLWLLEQDGAAGAPIAFIPISGDGLLELLMTALPPGRSL